MTYLQLIVWLLGFVGVALIALGIVTALAQDAPLYDPTVDLIDQDDETPWGGRKDVA